MQCGHIKEGIDERFMAAMFKNILNLQSNMNVKMKRDECIALCIASMKSDLSSLGLQMEDVIPSIKHEIEANFENFNTQLEAFKDEIIQAIQTQSNQTTSEKEQRIYDLSTSLGELRGKESSLS